jgi:hypothetical protein
MLPPPSALPARLPSLAEVEHGAALREHGLLTCHPGGDKVDGRAYEGDTDHLAVCDQLSQLVGCEVA